MKLKTILIILILAMSAIMIGNIVMIGEISQLYHKTEIERQELDQRYDAMVWEFGESLKSINLFSCIQTVNPRLTNEETAEFTNLVFQYSAESGVDPYEIFAKSWVETWFNPYAPGAAGEQGFIQVMPGTFRLYLEKFGYTMDDFKDWRCTLRVGIVHYKVLLDQHKDWKLAEAAYNAGTRGNFIERAGNHVRKVVRANNQVSRYREGGLK